MDGHAEAWVGGGVLQGHSNGSLPNMDLDSHSSDVPPHAAIVACGAAIHATSSCSGSLALLSNAAKPQPKVTPELMKTYGGIHSNQLQAHQLGSVWNCRDCR